jgi:hypothetical protein
MILGVKALECGTPASYPPNRRRTKQQHTTHEHRAEIVGVQSAAGRSSGACSRPDPADLPGAGGKHRAGGRCRRIISTCCGKATAVVAGEAGAVHQGAIIATVAGRISAPAHAVLGATSVVTGIFLRDSGRGGQEDDHGVHRESEVGRDDQGFKITAPAEP